MRIEGYNFIVTTFSNEKSNETEEIVFDLLIPDEAKNAIEMLIDITQTQTLELESMDEIKEFYIQASKN